MKSLIFITKVIVIGIIQFLGLIISIVIFMSISGSNYITGFIGSIAGGILWTSLVLYITKADVVFGHIMVTDGLLKNKFSSKKALDYSQFCFRMGLILLALYIFIGFIKINL